MFSFSFAFAEQLNNSNVLNSNIRSPRIKCLGHFIVYGNNQDLLNSKIQICVEQLSSSC
jgi:hypothetical protein